MSFERQASGEGRSPETLSGVSIDSFVQKVDEDMRESVIQLIMEDPDVAEAAIHTASSQNISKAAGEYFRTLIPGSLHKPKQEYIHEGRESFLEDVAEGFSQELARLIRLRSRIGDEVFERRKKDFVESLLCTPAEKIGEVEVKTVEGTPIQTMQNSFYLEGSRSVVKENILNIVGGESNTPMADLFVDGDSQIELTQLLPNDFVFTPAELYPIQEVFNEEKKKLELVIKKKDLHTYRGTKNAGDNFFMQKELKCVSYGDLTKKGGMLSLFHEVAHAWQSVYHGDQWNREFQSFYKRVTVNLAIIEYLQELIGRGEIDSEYFKEKAQELLSELKDLGVDFDIDHFAEDRPLEQDEYKVQGPSSKSFIIKSERLGYLIAGYEREERDAWAHAIRVIRFLRIRGVDLEPQLKDLSDFKDVVDPCLGTYQTYLEHLIKDSPRKIRFAKQKRV